MGKMLFDTHPTNKIFCAFKITDFAQKIPRNIAFCLKNNIKFVNVGNIRFWGTFKARGGQNP